MYPLWFLLNPKLLFWFVGIFDSLLKYRLADLVGWNPYPVGAKVFSRKELKGGRQVEADIQQMAIAGSIIAQIETF